MRTDGEQGTTSGPPTPERPTPERLIADFASSQVTGLGGGHGLLAVMVRETALGNLGQSIDAGLDALVARWKHTAAPGAGRVARRMSFSADRRR